MVSKDCRAWGNSTDLCFQKGFSSRHENYHLRAALDSGNSTSYLRAQLLSAKGLGRKWKFIFKQDDGVVVNQFWLNTNATCSNGTAGWNAEKVTQVFVQYTD
jgi:hypothetical protein